MTTRTEIAWGLICRTGGATTEELCAALNFTKADARDTIKNIRKRLGRDGAVRVVYSTVIPDCPKHSFRYFGCAKSMATWVAQCSVGAAERLAAHKAAAKASARAAHNARRRQERKPKIAKPRKVRTPVVTPMTGIRAALAAFFDAAPNGLITSAMLASAAGVTPGVAIKALGRLRKYGEVHKAGRLGYLCYFARTAAVASAWVPPTKAQKPAKPKLQRYAVAAEKPSKPATVTTQRRGLQGPTITPKDVPHIISLGPKFHPLYGVDPATVPRIFSALPPGRYIA